jgi:CBS domain-containing protein
MRDISVGEILKYINQEDVYQISLGATIKEAADFMAKRNIGALPVMDGNSVVGIVTDRDMAHVVANGIDSQTSVTKIMTHNPVTVSRLAISKECEDLMKKHNFRHLLVVENGVLLGIVSIKDILVVTRSDYEFVASQLHGHIMGQ